MRIGYFVYQLDNFSGAAFQALSIAKELTNEQFVFFNQSYIGKTEIRKMEENIIVINLGRNKFRQPFTILYYILKFKIGILHFHGFFPLFLLIGVALRKKIIVKTTLSGDDDFDSILKSKFGKIKLFLLKRLDLNIVLSKYLEDINLKYLKKNKVIRIPNGVSLKAQLDIKKEMRTFCFVGVVSERKRTYEAIEYFVRNYSHLENSKMLIVGPYESIDCLSDINPVYVEKCFDLSKSIAENKIQFLGKLTKQETQKVFQQSIALLFFSDKEGMPNVVLEAMAHNCVPIISPIQGVGYEIVDHSHNGFVLEDLNLCVDYKTILNVQRSSSPQKKIENKFSIKSISMKYKDIYDRLLVSANSCDY